MTYTPDMNDGQHIFVFGSNLAGWHSAGAAKTAREEWGARTGIGVGRTGQSYAIPTKDEHILTLDLEPIARAVEVFKLYAKYNPELTFLVTAIGTGLAGYEHKDIAPLFKDCPSNCVLPEEWKDYK